MANAGPFEHQHRPAYILAPVRGSYLRATGSEFRPWLLPATRTGPRYLYDVHVVSLPRLAAESGLPLGSRLRGDWNLLNQSGEIGLCDLFAQLLTLLKTD